MTEQKQIQSYGVTDTGLVRKNNEDSFLCDDKCGFWVVADGMGGHDAGEIASDIAATRLHALVQATDETISEELLTDLVQEVNCEIWDYGRSHNLVSGLGTTLTALIQIDKEHALIAHVGDSRLFRVRGLEVEQITTDHSWVQQQVDLGEITMDEARFHPNKNVIMRSMGFDSNVEPDILQVKLSKGDSFLIASDGLTNKLSAEDIGRVLARTENSRAGLQGLIQLALERGGEDNITVVLVEVPE